MSYDQRHGGPYDRGGADAWYRRGCTPHYYKGDTYSSERVEEENMTEEEIKAYLAGYDEINSAGDFKDWGDDSYDSDDYYEDENDED